MKKTLEQFKEIVARENGYPNWQNVIENFFGTVDLGDLANKMYYEQSEWISVEDALPENNENVLCYNGYRMIENSYSMYTDQDQNWFKKKFTHWQPLPNPPQK